MTAVKLLTHRVGVQPPKLPYREHQLTRIEWLNKPMGRQLAMAAYGFDRRSMQFWSPNAQIAQSAADLAVFFGRNLLSAQCSSEGQNLIC